MAVTVSYNVQCTNANNFPTTIINSTTPPTTQQASTVQEVFCQVIMADSDTQATLTHNWGFTASQSQNFGSPQVVFWQVSGSTAATQTFAPFISFDIVTSTNAVKMNKGNFANTGGVWNIALRRPWSASS